MYSRKYEPLRCINNDVSNVNIKCEAMNIKTEVAIKAHQMNEKK